MNYMVIGGAGFIGSHVVHRLFDEEKDATNQTHGVGYDFVRRLKDNPGELRILGDGTQSKSHIYVFDVVDSLRLVGKRL